MHFQHPPFAEKKLVSCLAGQVFDVAVDLRKASPTFLQWHAEILTATNGRTLFIPEGFAHGFQTLVDDCELLYLHSAPYSAESEAGLSATDPALNIAWPRAIAGRSRRDVNLPTVNNEFTGIQL
jgi:dTDP-4-dehydrorhamnose 3,5-epimerase